MTRFLKKISEMYLMLQENIENLNKTEYWRVSKDIKVKSSGQGREEIPEGETSTFERI